MKIFTSAQTHKLDQHIIAHEPIKNIDLMERAVQALIQATTEEWTNRTPVVVFAGPGNNGGDAPVVARMLTEKDYTVSVYLFNISNKLLENCAINKKRIVEVKKADLSKETTLNSEPPTLDADTLVVDGLFGSELNKPLNGGFASPVRYTDQSACQVVSIDLPSELLPEGNTSNVYTHIIKANLTLTLQQKKLAMMLSDMRCPLGRVKVLNIRLSEEFTNKTDATHTILEEQDVRRKLLRRSCTAHKGDMGRALLVADSYGMAGAAVLATRACLRVGVGKVTVCSSQHNDDILQISIPGAVIRVDADENVFSEPVDTDDFDTLGIGSGLGQDETMVIAMIVQMCRAQCPAIVDADALNMLGMYRAWMQQLLKNIIPTSHPKELDRLVGNTRGDSHERLQKAIELAQRLHGYASLKGYHTAFCPPNGHVIFNATGNAGMATAGSGDMLTGIITGLAARGYQLADACAVGMYLHGLAGDLAARELGQENTTAGDIVRFIPQAFKRLND